MRKWLKKHLINLILTLIILAGVALLAYPTVSDWWNSMHQSQVIGSYLQEVSRLSPKEYERILKSAEEYNARLGERGINWNPSKEDIEAYNKELNLHGTGVMGYIDIPKINIKLPIYHGIEDTVLQIAIGHLEGTSLPVGGYNSHCVISGHRGLPSARLFTDLDKVVEGDTWTITVLNKTITYECDQIRVVNPSNLSDLRIEPGQDYCTLVTCTPYGINTHRLLVRGHRIANASGEANVIADAISIDSIFIAPFLAVPIMIIVMIEMIIVSNRRRKRRITYEALKKEQ